VDSNDRCSGQGKCAVSGFGGLVVTMLTSGTQDGGLKKTPARSPRIFRAKKQQHAFLSRGSKAV
jgi:hypothetical protein